MPEDQYSPSMIAYELLLCLAKRLQDEGRGSLIRGPVNEHSTITCVDGYHASVLDFELRPEAFVPRFIEPAVAAIFNHLSDKFPVGNPIAFDFFGALPIGDLCFANASDPRLGIACRVVKAYRPGSIDGIRPEGWYTRYEVAWSKP